MFDQNTLVIDNLISAVAMIMMKARSGKTAKMVAAKMTFVKTVIDIHGKRIPNSAGAVSSLSSVF